MHDQSTHTRRQLIGSVARVLIAGVVGGAATAQLTGGRRVLGVEPVLRAAATALEPAVRLALHGDLHFPVDVAGGDLVIPNGFGGVSGVKGAGGHNGVDIGNGCSDGRGRPLLACVDGTLNSEKVLSTAGRLRVLADDVGNYYRYHHLDAYAPEIEVGDRVRRGDVIGYMGSSGNTSWSHLHFEVWIGGISPGLGGRAVDPLPRLPLPIPGVTVGLPDC
ncbi:MAG: M23 family metallopeptidase [Ilumatobacter sp.]|nr:M23 family metallopeptidase [Ilumatobacter sp.]